MLTKCDRVSYWFNYNTYFYLPSNGFTLIHANKPSSSWRYSPRLFYELKNFLISKSTDLIFSDTGQRKMSLETRDKFSQSIPKPEKGLKVEKGTT